MKKPNKSAAYGPISTIGEWVHCLVSAKHAETTWLRVAPDQERLALRIVERVVYTLFGILIATIVFAYHQYNFYKDVSTIEYDKQTIYIREK